PRVIGAVPGRPDDRANLAAAKVELEPRRTRHRRRREALGGRDLGVPALCVGPLVEEVEQPLQLQVREGEHVPQAAGEERPAVTDGRPATDGLDAHRHQRVQVERRAFGRAGELRRGEPARTLEILELVVTLVPNTGRVHPPQDVAAAIRSRQPYVLADREDHRPSRLLQLGRELHSRRRRTDDEHTALRELGGVAVGERRQLLDVGRHSGRERRDRRDVAGSTREHDGAGAKLPVARPDLVPVARTPHRRDVRAGANRRARVRRIASDQLGDVRARHVAVGIGALVVATGEPALPVRRQQPQRVPPLVAPGVRHLAALEDDVVNGPLGEEVACGEAGVPGPYDDGGEALDGASAQATSTVTSVGFVRASNTAERFCDCATSASISCFEASASILNVTFTSLKPFRTSLSTPRIPRMSWLPSTVDSTERSWIPRFCATEATPAVRQLARPTSRYSIGVIPLSVAAKTSGWSASNTASVLCSCSPPSPKKFLIVVVLWTPSSHLEDAFHVNWAASGAPARASRASSSACTLTPLSTTLVIAPPFSA